MKLFFSKFYSVLYTILKDKSNKNQIVYRIYLAFAWQLYKKICPFPLIIELDNKLLYILEPKAGNSVGVIYTKIYEADYIIFLRKNIEKNGIFIDVGAHTGLYTLLLHPLYSSAIALEPDGETFELLSRNIGINKIKSIELICAGASDCDDIGFLKRTGKYSGTTCLVDNSWSESDQIISVPILKIDNLINDKGIEKINCMKIDTEGHELKVLKGALKILKRSPNAIVLYENSNFEEIRSLFTQIGWRIFTIDKKEKIITDLNELSNAYNLFACGPEHKLFKFT